MADLPDQKIINGLLLDYYDAQGRELPWRKNCDPYRVWVSEVMLQQTRVDTVVPYFNRWIEKFPQLSDLAHASEESVLNVWQGLGYYSRAHNLLKAIRIVAKDMNGLIPRDPIELRELPGIGEYTANAIASIAYDHPVVAIDANLRRVLSRLFDLPDPSPAELKCRATSLLDANRPGDWNQALMDLGATICIPKNPICEKCPVENHCKSADRGTQNERSMPKLKQPVRSSIQAVVIAVNSKDEFLLRKRPPRGLLAGLWEFPGSELVGNSTTLTIHKNIANGLGFDLTRDQTELISLDSVVHKFSHLTVTYRPVLVIGVNQGTHCDNPDYEFRWVEGDLIKNLPLPVGQQKLFKLSRKALVTRTL